MRWGSRSGYALKTTRIQDEINRLALQNLQAFRAAAGKQYVVTVATKDPTQRGENPWLIIDTQQRPAVL